MGKISPEKFPFGIRSSEACLFLRQVREAGAGQPVEFDFVESLEVKGPVALLDDLRKQLPSARPQEEQFSRRPNNLMERKSQGRLVACLGVRESDLVLLRLKVVRPGSPAIRNFEGIESCPSTTATEPPFDRNRWIAQPPISRSPKRTREITEPICLRRRWFDFVARTRKVDRVTIDFPRRRRATCKTDGIKGDAKGPGAAIFPHR